MSRREGSVGIDCPSCGIRPVETAARLWFMRGFAIFARYGSAIVIGCHTCVRDAARRSAMKNLTLGWWSIPWGIATPIVIVQNLLRGGGDRAELTTALARLGIAYEDVVVDHNGMTGEERRLLWAYANVAERASRCGQGGAGVDRASELLVELTGRRVTASAAADAIREAAKHDLPLRRLDVDDRLGLIGFAVALVSVSGAPGPAARTMIQRLVQELGLPPEVAAAALAGDEVVVDEGELAEALRILGVAAGTPLPDVKRRYRQLVVQYHPDRAALNGLTSAEATSRTQEITAAYHVVCSAQGYATV